LQNRSISAPWHVASITDASDGPNKLPKQKKSKGPYHRYAIDCNFFERLLWGHINFM
jgi:hypothetical protein